MTFKVQFVASWNVLKNEGDPSIIRRINEFITGIDYSYQLEKTGELSIDHGLKRTRENLKRSLGYKRQRVSKGSRSSRSASSDRFANILRLLTTTNYEVIDGMRVKGRNLDYSTDPIAARLRGVPYIDIKSEIEELKEEIAGGVELGSDEGVAWTDVPKVSDFLFQHLEEDQAGKWSIKPPTIQDNKSYRLPDEKELSDIEKLVMLLYQKLYNIKMIHSSDVVRTKTPICINPRGEIASSLGVSSSSSSSSSSNSNSSSSSSSTSSASLGDGASIDLNPIQKEIELLLRSLFQPQDRVEIRSTSCHLSVKNNKSNKCGKHVVIEGPSGIGKSVVAETFFKKCNRKQLYKEDLDSGAL